VTQTNFPDTVQLGDVKDVSSKDLPKIDLILGGSPCQGFSSIGTGKGLDDPRSKLFYEFVRLLEECRPRHFLLENVRMRKQWLDIITESIGVEPIRINSSLVSAQNRVRIYWTNIPNVTQPEDLGITLGDVIEDPEEFRTPGSWTKYVPKSRPKYVDPYNRCEIVGEKSTSLRTNVNNGNMWVRAQSGKYRNLTTVECERLQTVPVGYTDSVSPAQAKKLLGNGWTVDVISHIVQGLQCSGSA
jgi:site-specific DNA-cytosine methylase